MDYAIQEKKDNKVFNMFLAINLATRSSKPPRSQHVCDHLLDFKITELFLDYTELRNVRKIPMSLLI